MLDPARQHVPVHRLELVGDAVDDERLHPAQHQTELLMRVAVQRDGRSRLELDDVQHRSVSEQRPATDPLSELERADVVEADEDRFHGETLLRVTFHTPPQPLIDHRFAGRHAVSSVTVATTAPRLLRSQAYVDGAGSTPTAAPLSGPEPGHRRDAR